MPRMFHALLALAAIALGIPGGANATQVALSFDDLPGLTLHDQDTVDRFNHDLLAGLERHHIPATGFVNEGKIDELDRQRQIAILGQWLRAGMDLGNHTYSHESLDTLDAGQFVADISRGEGVIRGLMAQHGKRLHWFRYPNLETGKDAATKAWVANWLVAHRYRSAPVTIDADDWEFAEPYEDALLGHDTARAARIRAEYLAHTAKTIDWSRRAARTLFGRDIAYVMLLHDSRLNADCIDGLAALFGLRHMHFVSLDHAMRDPAYRTPDPYVGPDGIEWLERWSQALGRTLPWDDFSEVPVDIREAYDRLDTDRN